MDKGNTTKILREVTLLHEKLDALIARKRVAKIDNKMRDVLSALLEKHDIMSSYSVSVADLYDITGVEKTQANGLIFAKIMRDAGYESKVLNIKGRSIRHWIKEEDMHI